MHSITFNSLLVLLLVSSNTVLSLNDAKFLGERSQILNNGVDSNQRLSRRESTDGVEGSHSKRRIRGLNHQCKLSLKILKKNQFNQQGPSFLSKNECALLIFFLFFWFEMKIN